ncbi:ATP-binding protein [Candidatus Aerophobetes bacterium]|uniref:histidine kinase n=1 Tax=Aerophobetes bacterium TaxID=2030807 RepID=A0A662DMK4_UNCAE|nr:MAG: ATP-binding protein [Candidatus Aerophobetes bacterium]
MHDLSLHILDIVENSINAKATRVEILIEEDLVKDRLRITIIDNGVGMDSKLIPKITDPFATTRTCRKVGLGLSLLKTRAKQCHGDVTISSCLGKGTTVEAFFQYGNVDRPPLGDIASTVLCIISANPSLDVIYKHRVGDMVYQLDTRKIKKLAGECYFKNKGVLALISKDIKRGLCALKKERKKVFKKVFGYVPKVDLV